MRSAGATESSLRVNDENDRISPRVTNTLRGIAAITRRAFVQTRVVLIMTRDFYSSSPRDSLGTLPLRTHARTHADPSRIFQHARNGLKVANQRPLLSAAVNTVNAATTTQGPPADVFVSFSRLSVCATHDGTCVHRHYAAT